MIKVRIPPHHISEHEYLLRYIFRRTKIEGYIIQSNNLVSNDVIIKNNNKTITLTSSFFRNTSIDFRNQKLPTTVIHSKQANLFCLYGEDVIEKTQDECTIKLDFLGTLFFFLTRWEEYTFAHQKSDSHRRFIGKETFAAKNNLIDTPVVDHIIYYLNNLFIEYNLAKKTESSLMPSSFFFSHDVDFILQCPRWNDRLKKVLKSDRLSPFTLLHSKEKYRNSDLYNNFDFLMDISENANLKSTFFLMLGGDHDLDFKYELNDDFKWLIDKIKKRNHHFGIHPSYQSSENFEILKQEIETFKTLFPDEKLVSRQHYLRFKVPETINWLENLGVKEEHSFGYSDISGFRCGTAAPFKYFDFLQRKALDITIFPLIGMDVTLIYSENLSENQILEKIENWIKSLPALDDIQLSILFHNHVVHACKELYTSIGKLGK